MGKIKEAQDGTKDGLRSSDLDYEAGVAFPGDVNTQM